MIGIIDYDAGNIRSVEKAIHLLGEDTIITRDESILEEVDGIILPGVGAFGDAMKHLRYWKLDQIIHRLVAKNKPLLGVCLGLQLLFESSEESRDTEGLGLLPGKVIKIPQINNIKIPHMGWNTLQITKDNPLLQGIKDEAYVYFVHSYYVLPSEQCDIIGLTDYETIMPVAVGRNHLYGLQFHPEKSSAVGLKILSNFIEISRKQ